MLVSAFYLLGLLAFGGAGNLCDAPERGLPQGICLVRAGNYAEAAGILKPYAESRPGDFQGWYWLAQSALLQRQFEEAETSIRRAIELNPDSAAAQATLGKIELERGNHQAAYRAWLEAHKLDPKDATSTYYIGRLFFEADFSNEAASWFRETLKLSPNHYAAMTYLALCAERLNFEKTALELYPAAIRESKRQGKPFSWAYLNYAKLLRQLGRNKEAKSVLEESAKLCPEGHVLTALGQLLASENETAQAEAVLHQVIALDPGIPDAHYRLSVLLRKDGQEQQAEEELRKFEETKDADDKKLKIQAIRKQAE